MKVFAHKFRFVFMIFLTGGYKTSCNENKRSEQAPKVKINHKLSKPYDCLVINHL